MVSLNYEKTISSIMDGLVKYIYKLEEYKTAYNYSLDDYNKLNGLYENMDYDLDKFVKEFAKSKKEQKEYFNSIVNEIYKDPKKIKELYNETRTDYLISFYSSINTYRMLNDFKSKLKDKIDSLSLMLSENELNDVESKIEKYIDFSNIFDKDKLKEPYNINDYIDIIESLNISPDDMIHATELALIEVERLTKDKNEEDLIQLEEFNIDEEEHEENFLDKFIYDKPKELV